MVRHRRPALAAAASMLCLLGTLAAPAAAAVSQPAAPRAGGPFKIGPSDSPGTVALTANGTRVAVFDISSGRGKVHVCLIAATGRKCARSTYLSPPASGDFTNGTPGVFIPSRNHVLVLQRTCCDTNPNSSVLYASADGGKTFSAPVRVGAIGVDHSELVAGHVVFTEQDTVSGLRVVSVPVAATRPGATATILAKVATDTGLGQYHRGVLAAMDYNGTRSYTSYVYYAPGGKNFDAAGSYHRVAAFGGESLLAMSGAALLTEKGSKAVLRMFNGTRYGPAHAVPHVYAGLGSWLTVDQDPSGHVHVFAILAKSGYEMFELSTSDGGARWARPVRLGNGINSIWLSAALNSKGRGMVLGNSPAWGYPVP